MIRRLGLGSKVLVIGAPGVDAHTHEILDELGWPVPTSVPFVAHLDGRGRIAIDPSLGERDRYDVARYQNAIHSGLVQIR